MWIYALKEHTLFRDGVEISSALYSGYPPYVNLPDYTHLKDLGPIPAGDYVIGNAYEDAHRGKLVMGLSPSDKNHMYGRGGFAIHGDSVRKPGLASHGCIIANNPTRSMISKSSDKIIRVVIGIADAQEIFETLKSQALDHGSAAKVVTRQKPVPDEPVDS